MFASIQYKIFFSLTRINTLELENRNIKKAFYSWFCHSDTVGKILQKGERSLSTHISDSWGDRIHKATSR